MRISPASFLLLVVGTACSNSALLVSAKKELTAEELERSVLLEFYEATNGHSWNENTGWAHETPNVCTWMGVECLLSAAEVAAVAGAGSGSDDDDEAARRNPVVGLYLSDNFLSGRTPASLWKLPALKTLDVGFNDALDVDFGSLSDVIAPPPLETVSARATATTSARGVAALSDTLTKLNFSKNKFESQFPPDLLELRKLTYLGLSECSLRGSLPDGDNDSISKLSQLRVLDVYDNDLTGTLPEGLASLVHLRSLILSKNQFHGKLPQFVNDELVLLEEFWVVDCWPNKTCINKTFFVPSMPAMQSVSGKSM